MSSSDQHENLVFYLFTNVSNLVNKILLILIIITSAALCGRLSSLKVVFFNWCNLNKVPVFIYRKEKLQKKYVFSIKCLKLFWSQKNDWCQDSGGLVRVWVLDDYFMSLIRGHQPWHQHFKISPSRLDWVSPLLTVNICLSWKLRVGWLTLLLFHFPYIIWILLICTSSTFTWLNTIQKIY